jgi:acylglycerol lipase
MHKTVKASLLFLVLILSACSPYIEGLGPNKRVPDIEGDRFLTSDGLDLPLRIWDIDHEPKAILLGVHGFNDFGEFLTPGFPEYLQKNDILLITYDQRGFGQNINRGIWVGTEALVSDLSTLIHLVHSRYENIPLFVIGESMGGAVAMTTLATIKPLPVDGLILSAPAVWGPSTWPWYQKATLYALSYSVPWLKLSGGGIVQPTDHMENWKNWSKNPLVIRETRVDAIWGVSWLMDEAQAAVPAIMLPSLILYGEKDQVIPWKATQTMISKLNIKHHIALYPEGWHWLSRDHNGPVVWQDIVSWITDHNAPLPSGADVGAREKLLTTQK